METMVQKARILACVFLFGVQKWKSLMSFDFTFFYILNSFQLLSHKIGL